MTHLIIIVITFINYFMQMKHKEFYAGLVVISNKVAYKI